MNTDISAIAARAKRVPASRGKTLPRRRGLRLWLALAVLAIMAGVWLVRSRWNADLLVLQHLHPTLPAGFWLAITLQGDGWVMFALVSALDGGRRTMVAVYLRCALLMALVTPLAKGLLAVPRPAASLPAGSLHIIGPQLLGSNSFPSGHALTAGGCAVILCMLLPRAGRPARTDWLLRGAIGLNMALVAYSRTAVGAHWPADVLLGFGLGILVALFALWTEHMAPWAERLQTRAGSAVIVLLQLAAAVAIFRLGADGRADPVVATALGVGALLLCWRSLRNLPGPALRQYHAG